MLKGTALNYNKNNLESVLTYSECVQRLFQTYTSDEQCNLLLQEWHSTTLSSLMALMASKPEKLQMNVFKGACARLSAIQRQLHPEYHRDRFPRDQIVRIADTLDIGRSLRKLIPGTAHEETQRIAALLSTSTGSASDYTPLLTAGDNVSFGTDRRFSGQALKKFPPRGQRGRGIMSRKVKGCWVCGENNFARDYHSGKVVRMALDRHRRRGRAYVAIEDVVQLCSDEYASEDDAAMIDDAETGTSTDTSNDCDIANFAITELNSTIEQSLSNRAFQHGYASRYSKEISNIYNELKKLEDFEPEFPEFCATQVQIVQAS